MLVCMVNEDELRNFEDFRLPRRGAYTPELQLSPSSAPNTTNTSAENAYQHCIFRMAGPNRVCPPASRALHTRNERMTSVCLRLRARDVRARAPARA